MENRQFPELPDIITVSSKGQVVIPKDIRDEMGIEPGSVFAVACPFKDMVVLKRIRSPLLKEDLEQLRNLEEAWAEIERGECRSLPKDEFLRELDRWSKGEDLCE